MRFLCFQPDQYPELSLHPVHQAVAQGTTDQLGDSSIRAHPGDLCDKSEAKIYRGQRQMTK